MAIPAKRLLLAGLAASLLLSLASRAGDVAGSRDHPMVSRYADSEIIAYEEQAFDEYDLIVDKVTHYGGRAKNREATQSLEGKLTLISYKVPAQRTTLEVLRNTRRPSRKPASRYCSHARTRNAGAATSTTRSFRTRPTSVMLTRTSVISSPGSAARKATSMLRYTRHGARLMAAGPTTSTPGSR